MLILLFISLLIYYLYLLLPEQQNIADNTFNDIIEFAEVKEQKPTFELFTLLDYTTMNIDFKLVFGDIKCIDHLYSMMALSIET